MVNKKLLQDFRKDFSETIKELEDKYNLKIELGKISYTSTSFTGKFEAIVDEIDGKSGEQIEFEKICELYGLKASDYNREFKMDNELYVLVGINRKARKNRYIIKSVNSNKEYVMSNIKDYLKD